MEDQDQGNPPISISDSQSQRDGNEFNNNQTESVVSQTIQSRENNLSIAHDASTLASSTNEKQNSGPVDKQQTSAQTSTRDDEALSSLLLLLKANSSKQEEETRIQSPSGKSPRPPETPNLEKTQPKVDTGKQPLTKTIKVDDLRKFFHLPILQVAKQLGICTTLLKRICRCNNIKKWPYRQIRSITKSIQSLQMAALNQSLQERERGRFLEQIQYLQYSLDALIEDPSRP
eukprot:gene3591-7135_t